MEISVQILRRRAAFLTCAFLLSIAAGTFIGIAISHSGLKPSNSSVLSIADCSKEVIKSLGRVSADFDLLRLASEHCHRQIHGQSLLSEFSVRQSQFYHQYYVGSVILWMVVILTLSGVALAAAQLIVSYHLASLSKALLSEPNHELTVEQGKLVVKSSATGLLILVVSFAFFFVFILRVYPIEEVRTSVPPFPSSQSISDGNGPDAKKGVGKILSSGSLGLPLSDTQKGGNGSVFNNH